MPRYYDPVELSLRKRSTLLQVIRVGFVLVLLSAGMIRLFALGGSTNTGDLFLARNWYLPIAVAAIMAGIFLAIDLLNPAKKIATLVSVSVGLLVGVTATIVVSFVIDFLAEIYAIDKSFIFMFKVFLGISMSFLGVTFVLQTQDDVRLVIPYVEFAKQLRGPRPLLMDSSALIDARFADALQTGFFQAPIVVPRFVIGELQQLADSQDKLKRAKGRRALDIVARLQRTAALDVSIDPTSTPGIGVDQALIELAVRTRGVIVTTDSGLAKVAAIQGATVLNVNDLATALRPALAAGETVTVKLVKPGEQPGQAVGYLPDGTMVVAEDGAPHVGRDTPLIVISTLQTSAGRLIFARTVPTGPDTDRDAAPPEPSAPAHDAGEPADSAAAEESTGESASEPTPPAPGAAKNAPRPQGPFGPHASPRGQNRLRNPRR